MTTMLKITKCPTHYFHKYVFDNEKDIKCKRKRKFNSKKCLDLKSIVDIKVHLQNRKMV